MNDIIEKLHECVEFGKADKASPFPPQLKGQDGSKELTQQALEAGISASDILDNALVPAMAKVGEKFSQNKIFVPQMLMSARAMGASMVQLKPYFASGAVKAKGTFIIGTVKGDLHDIGKNLVAMMVEGAGYTIVDLGVDVSSDKFLEALKEHPDAVVGLSALLTTTMVSMEEIVEKIKAESPSSKILIGGAPVTDEFCTKIGADFYAPDPQRAVDYLNKAS